MHMFIYYKYLYLNSGRKQRACMPPQRCVPWKQGAAATFILTTTLSCQRSRFSLRSRWLGLQFPSCSTSHRLWDLSDTLARKGRQGSANPCVAAWHCQNSSVPCTPPFIIPPALSSHLPLISLAKGGRIGLFPLVLTYLDIEIIISELGFHIYITYNVTQICPFTVITNEVILNNLSEIDFGGLFWGPPNIVTFLGGNVFLVSRIQLTNELWKQSICKLESSCMGIQPCPGFACVSFLFLKAVLGGFELTLLEFLQLVSWMISKPIYQCHWARWT